MAFRSITDPKLQASDKDVDALSKIAANSGPQAIIVLEDGVAKTDVKISGILFGTDSMSITSITGVDVDGTLAGKTFKAGFFLPVQCTAVTVSGGFAIAFKHSD